jgi:dephospho-CoA kinase
MRDLVFQDASQRQRLETILHPMIRTESQRQLRELEALHPYLMLVIPLLVESGHWRERVGRVLVVDCDEAIQVQRVMSRNHLDEAQVRAIMSAQATRAARLAVADDVIDNSGGPAQLAPLVARLHENYCNLQAQTEPAGR